MLAIFLLFIVVVVLFTLGVKLAVNYMGKIVSRLITRQHKAAESITDTGKVPPEWVAELEKRYGPVKMAAQDDARIKVRDKIKGQAIKKLSKLMEYFEKSPFVSDRETRRILKQQLKQTMTDWQEREWQEII